MARRRKAAASQRRLPPELITAILKHLLPFDVEDGDDMNLSRYSLRMCCLVSRQFRDCAQPLLFDSIKIEYPEKVHEFCELHKRRRRTKGGKVGRGLGKYCRTLAIGTFDNEFNDLDEVRLAFEECPNVVDLRFQSIKHPNEIVPVTMFAECTKIRRLTLPDMVLSCSWPKSIPITFPLLAELSLMKLAVAPDELANLLQPSCLPALRCLFIAQTKDRKGDKYFPNLSPRFLRQWTSFKSSWETCPSCRSTCALISALPSQLLTTSLLQDWITRQTHTPVLVEVNLTLATNASLPRIRHLLYSELRVDDPNFAHNYHHMVETVLALEQLASSPARTRNSPLTLYLPHDLDPSLHAYDGAHYRELRQARNKLLRTCQRAGESLVRVVWRDERDLSGALMCYPRASQRAWRDKDIMRAELARVAEGQRARGETVDEPEESSDDERDDGAASGSDWSRSDGEGAAGDDDSDEEAEVASAGAESTEAPEADETPFERPHASQTTQPQAASSAFNRPLADLLFDASQNGGGFTNYGDGTFTWTPRRGLRAEDFYEVD